MIKVYTPLTQVDTKTPTYKVGTRVEIVGGNEYIYLPGVASCGQFDWVNIITASALSYGSVTRLDTATAGPVGISQGTPSLTGNTFGWFQIRGVGWGGSGAVCSTGSPAFASGTVGLAMTTVDANNGIFGAFCIGTGGCVSGGTGGTAKFVINYPYNCGMVVT